jgi:hypothetical protein
MKTKTEALARAREVRLLMRKPRTWKLCVWENIGWHWCLEAADGMFTVNEYSGRFSCMMCDHWGHKHCGSYNWKVDKHWKDPNRAVREQLKAAKNYAEKVVSHVAKICIAINT